MDHMVNMLIDTDMIQGVIDITGSVVKIVYSFSEW